MQMSPIPAKPFDLDGEWGFENGAKVWMRQGGGEITMTERFSGRETLYFRGRYLSNPVITGQGLNPVSGGLAWGETKITVNGPDHLVINGRRVYRISKPAANDIPCDPQNSNHVMDYYAWLRGKTAYDERQYASAKCWLTIASDWQYTQAQSMLAAMITEGTAGTPPDYRLAFDLAGRSADDGDPGAQVQLAAMYRNGKGTAANPEKARYWLEKAEQSERFEQMRAKMTPEALASGISTVMGMVGSTMDFNMSMTPPSCFAKDVLGNKNAHASE
jgi:hypothetical protein